MPNNEKAIEQTGDALMKAIGKSENLIEQHEEVIEELKEDQEEIGSWLVLIFKSIKNALML